MSKNKHNGRGNGDDEDKGNVSHFPSFAERERMKREKRAQEEAWRKEYQKRNKAARRAVSAPFFNFGHIPPFTKYMSALLIFVHVVIHLVLPADIRLQIFYMGGFVPGYFTGAVPEIPWFAPMGAVTHMLIHSDWMHLGFNSVMLLALGMMYEKRYGTRRMAVFSLLCGVIGAATYFALSPTSTTPVIGASGAISGLFAVALILMNQSGQLGAIRRGSPWRIIAIWAAIMILMGFIGGFDGAALAWQAHLGGFLGGAALHMLRKNGYIRY